ncbi:hypothetical protein Tco_1475519 [Tanacetum coccineum]
MGLTKRVSFYLLDHVNFDSRKKCLIQPITARATLWDRARQSTAVLAQSPHFPRSHVKAEEEAQIGNSHDMNVVNKGKTQVNDDVIPVKEAVDNGKSKMIQVYHPVKKPLYINQLTILSEGEDELIDLRKRKTEAKKVPKSTNQKTLSDMVGSSSGIRRRRVYKVGDSETIIEHEEFMDELIEKLKDGGDVTTDPFKILESKVEKYPIHDVDTHWRMRKPKVGEKFDDVDQLKECLTYYALANGFSLWFYRSSNTQLIARCGLRPKKLKDRSRKANKENGKDTQVISMTDDHTCVRHFKYGTLVNYKWIGKHFGTKIRLNPEIKFIKNCRLRPSVGEILTAIGRDANDHVYLVAWAVINVKNKDNWRWFLDLLGDDLDMYLEMTWICPLAMD